VGVSKHERIFRVAHQGVDLAPSPAGVDTAKGNAFGSLRLQGIADLKEEAKESSQ
jgi:hypothetical protein